MFVWQVHGSFGMVLSVVLSMSGGMLGVLMPTLAIAAEHELNLNRSDLNRSDLNRLNLDSLTLDSLERPDNVGLPTARAVEEKIPGEGVPEEGIPEEEIPEEILRTEIITGARSPLTGEPITAVEYAQLQAELASPAGGNLVSPDLEYLIFLLQLRRAVTPIIPFIR